MLLQGQRNWAANQVNSIFKDFVPNNFESNVGIFNPHNVTKTTAQILNFNCLYFY